MPNSHIDSLKVSYYEGHRTGERIGEQRMMDAELAAVIPDCISFAERYPEIKVLGYDKPIREQKHHALKRRKGKR